MAGAVRVVGLRGKRIEITQAMRAAILDEMPEIGWISPTALAPACA